MAGEGTPPLLFCDNETNIAAGDTAELRLRLSRDAMPDLGDAWAATLAQRKRGPAAVVRA